MAKGMGKGGACGPRTGMPIHGGGKGGKGGAGGTFGKGGKGKPSYKPTMD